MISFQNVGHVTIPPKRFLQPARYAIVIESAFLTGITICSRQKQIKGKNLSQTYLPELSVAGHLSSHNQSFFETVA